MAISSRVRFRPAAIAPIDNAPHNNGDLPPANADFSKRNPFPHPRMSENVRRCPSFSSVNARVHIQKMRKTNHRPLLPFVASSLRSLRRFMILQNEAKLPITPYQIGGYKNDHPLPTTPGPHRRPSVFPLLVARGARAAGRPVICAALAGNASPDLATKPLASNGSARSVSGNGSAFSALRAARSHHGRPNPQGPALRPIPLFPLYSRSADHPPVHHRTSAATNAITRSCWR